MSLSGRRPTVSSCFVIGISLMTAPPNCSRSLGIENDLLSRLVTLSGDRFKKSLDALAKACCLVQTRHGDCDVVPPTRGICQFNQSFSRCCWIARFVNNPQNFVLGNFLAKTV